MNEPVSHNVLILDGETRSALAVTRSLGRRGVPVFVAAAHQPCLAGSSRYCRKAATYPSPANSSQAFAERLRSLVSELRPDVLLPLSDLTSAIVARIRGDLPASLKVPVPAAEALETALDKARMMRLASEVGIATPRTWEAESADALLSGAAGCYPLIAKPNRSWQKIGDEWMTGAVRTVNSEEEMAAVLAAARGAGINLIVQEYIPGWGEGLFVLCNHGSLRAVFAHRRLRESPPGGGVSTLRESIAADSRLVSAVTRLLERLEWHGPAMFEFRVDRRDGVPKLLEVNPRFWGSLHLAIASGQDFPWLLYRQETQGQVRQSMDYSVGVRSRWLLGDFNRLLLALRSRSNGCGSRWRELADFVKPDRDARLEIESTTDPRPALHEYALYASGLLRAACGLPRGGNER